MKTLKAPNIRWLSAGTVPRDAYLDFQCNYAKSGIPRKTIWRILTRLFIDGKIDEEFAVRREKISQEGNYSGVSTIPAPIPIALALHEDFKLKYRKQDMTRQEALRVLIELYASGKINDLVNRVWVKIQNASKEKE
jgi:hypothetical protein